MGIRRSSPEAEAVPRSLRQGIRHFSREFSLVLCFSVGYFLRWPALSTFDGLFSGFSPENPAQKYRGIPGGLTGKLRKGGKQWKSGKTVKNPSRNNPPDFTVAYKTRSQWSQLTKIVYQKRTFFRLLPLFRLFIRKWVPIRQCETLLSSDSREINRLAVAWLLRKRWKRGEKWRFWAWKRDKTGLREESP